MKKYFIILNLLCNVFVCVTTQAGLLLEPFFGGVTGKYSQKIDYLTSSEMIDGKISSLGGGFRIGASYPPIFIFGLDARFYKENIDYAEDLRVFNAENSMAGLFFGVDLILVRTWVTYFPLNQFKHLSQDVISMGKAYIIGVGAKMVPIFSINMEYMRQNFKSYKTSELKDYPIEKTLSTEHSPQLEMYILSLSFPLDFK